MKSPRFFKSPKLALPYGREHMESRMRTRRRPLYTCGKSVLATANRAYAKVRGSDVLLGEFAKLLEKSMRMARLIFSTLQYHCLAVLSATDSCILSAEMAVERIFPPSGYVFDKVDELVRISESFPERCDGVMNWIISWLEISVSAIARWESKSASKKEIRVDTGHDDRFESPDHTKGDEEAVGPTSGAQPVEAETGTKYVHKEGIEKATTEGGDKGKVGLIGEDQTSDLFKEKEEETGKKRKDGNGNSKGGKKEDSILDLFDTAWLKTQ